MTDQRRLEVPFVGPVRFIAFECEYRIGPDVIVAQGEHAPVPEPLSPAQAIVQAFDDRYELLGPLEDDWQEQCLAAALCALADLPSELEIPFNVITDLEAIPGSCARLYAAATWGCNQALAAQRAIAAELEDK